jgi:hypothetical protein
MRSISQTLPVVAALAFLSPVASADVLVDKVLFTHKAWKVNAVKHEDGSFACLADVQSRPSSFSIWAFVGAKTVFRLQFYNATWDLGEGTTANLRVVIDRQPTWELTNVELYKNSALFNLPAENSSKAFLLEIRMGNVLVMNSDSGNLASRHSLSGSSAAIDEFEKCVSALQSGTNLFGSN